MYLLSFIYGLYLMASTLVLFAIASNPNSLFVQNGAPVLDVNTYQGQARLRGLVYMQVWKSTKTQNKRARGPKQKGRRDQNKGAKGYAQCSRDKGHAAKRVHN